MVDKLLTDGGLEDDLVLRNLFEGLEHLFLSVGEEIKVLHRSLIEHDVAPNVLGVASFLGEQRLEVAIFANEVALGEPGLVVIGRIGLDAGRDLSENRRTGGGGRNGRHGGVAIFRPVVGLAFVEDGSAPVGCCEFERSLLGLFVDVAENLRGEIFGLHRFEGNEVLLQQGMPTEHTEPQRAVALCEAIGLTQEGGIAGLLDKLRHHGVEEPNGEAHGIGVLPLVPQFEVHRRKAAHETLFLGIGELNLVAKIGMRDFQTELLVDFRLVGVDIVGELDVGQAFLLSTLEHTGPDLALLGVAVDHLLHPVVGHADGIEKILDGAADVLDLQEFRDVGVVNVEISGKRAAAGGALRHGVHHRVEEAHERNGARRFSVVGDGRATAAQIAEIGRGAAAVLGLHHHFAEFDGDALDAVGDIAAETRNGEAARGAHVGPNGRTAAHPTFIYEFGKTFLEFWTVQPARCCAGDAIDGIVHGFAVEQIAAIEYGFRLFVVPPREFFGHERRCDEEREKENE